MEDKTRELKDRSLVLVFAYAPAGLGHLRVTNALYKGLPAGTNPLLLGSQDKFITWIHRVLSIHPVMRSLFEWGQQGLPQYFVTHLYRGLLHRSTKLLYRQIVTILDEQLLRPETLLIVATHFGLAHQISAIKDRLMKEQKIKLILVVQVTDDSPQYMWYVPGADLTFVPSERTKSELERYGKRARLKPVEFAVTPYPISPNLARPLSETRLAERQNQFDETLKTAINVAIPVSGAAVGMDFFLKLVDKLYERSPRFTFHIVSKTAIYTLPFLNELMVRPYVKLHLAALDREVVNRYDEVYKSVTVALEITKPSEQAFKALIRPSETGGSILLFAKPVGRQEYENLDFLVRHGLLPSVTEQKYLWERARRNLSLESSQEGERLRKESVRWRGMLLPDSSQASADYIWWAYREGLFKKMTQATLKPFPGDRYGNEVSPTGVREFWEKVAQHLSTL